MVPIESCDVHEAKARVVSDAPSRRRGLSRQCQVGCVLSWLGDDGCSPSPWGPETVNTTHPTVS